MQPTARMATIVAIVDRALQFDLQEPPPTTKGQQRCPASQSCKEDPSRVSSQSKSGPKIGAAELFTPLVPGVVDSTSHLFLWS